MYDKVIKNGEDVTKIYTAGGNKVRYYFSGMGDITITLNVLPSPIENSGQWYLADKDETIVFNLSGFQKTTRWKILRLKENELWYRVVENDPIFPDNETDVFECHLRPE